MDPQTDIVAQTDENAQKEDSHRASRLTVAGVLALVGARLAAEPVFLFNLLTGKGEPHSTGSGNNLLVKAGKRTFQAFGEKSTIIAASAGAAIFGVLGWIRGERIEHPTDLLKHPLKSFKVIFGKQSDNTPQAQTDISTPGTSAEQGANAAGNAWQKRVTTEQAATPEGRMI